MIPGAGPVYHALPLSTQCEGCGDALALPLRHRTQTQRAARSGCAATGNSRRDIRDDHEIFAQHKLAILIVDAQGMRAANIPVWIDMDW